MTLVTSRLFTMALLILSLSLVSCASKKAKTAGEDGSSSSVREDVSNNGLKFDVNGSSDSGSAGALQTVYFDFDSANIRSEAKAALDANVAFLKANNTVSVQVEGHCDERGGVQYNLALGEKRAKVVRDYLKSNGVSDSRISVVSYGKEKPVAYGHEEDSWGKNRRGNFVITAK